MLTLDNIPRESLNLPVLIFTAPVVNDRVAVHPSADSISTVNVPRSKSKPVSKILTAVGQPSTSIASIRIDALLSLPTRVYGFNPESVSLYLFKKYSEASFSKSIVYEPTEPDSSIE